MFIGKSFFLGVDFCIFVKHLNRKERRAQTAGPNAMAMPSNSSADVSLEVSHPQNCTLTLASIRELFECFLSCIVSKSRKICVFLQVHKDSGYRMAGASGSKEEDECFDEATREFLRAFSDKQFFLHNDFSLGQRSKN